MRIFYRAAHFRDSSQLISTFSTGEIDDLQERDRAGIQDVRHDEPRRLRHRTSHCVILRHAIHVPARSLSCH